MGGSSSASSAACSSGSGLYRLVAVPPFDPTFMARAADTAALLKAAVAQHSALKERLSKRLSEVGSCSALLRRNSTGQVLQNSLLAASDEASMHRRSVPAMDSKIE